MQHIFYRLKQTVITSFTVLLLMVFPAASVVHADDPAPCVAPSSSDPGVHTPTGADADMFVYQCDGQYQGDWLSDHYVYDPATNTKTPLDPAIYTYNDATGQWDTTVWNYSPVKNTYLATTVSVSTPPAGATTIGGPKPVVADTTSADQNTAGAGGDSSVTGSGTFTTGVNNTTGATMNNGVLSYANSGNAGVIGNTTAGGATTGNAQVIANIINTLQSTSNVLGGPNMVTFTANINGDVNGDLLLDPAKLSTIQPANASTNLDNNVTVNNSLDATMNNNVTLGANSGDATVAKNTTAGSATSGSADAVANIVNTINSAVTAGRSFLGVININGNLNGDILLPPNFINTLLASNVPRYDVDTSVLSNTTVTNNNTAAVTNNVNLGAASGDATVADNTKAGNATSGLAKTNLTVFNLTGSSVVASNDLLVFVNVLGQWYGMILNAPAGTTAASLGGGVISNNVTNNSTLNNTNNQTINNNLNVNAQSGDATVYHNTTAGDATSGNATASANIANFINDSLSLNGWFGLLFINVFGTWNGSFGIDTAAGNPITAPTSNNNTPAGSSNQPLFRFVSVTPGATNRDYNVPVNAVNADSTGSGAQVLAAKASKVLKQAAAPTTQTVTGAQKALNRLILPAIGAGFAFLILFVGERKRAGTQI